MKSLRAVRGGFEPPEQFPVRQFSKLVVSATHPPHRLGCKYTISHILVQYMTLKFCKKHKFFTLKIPNPFSIFVIL